MSDRQCALAEAFCRMSSMIGQMLVGLERNLTIEVGKKNLKIKELKLFLDEQIQEKEKLVAQIQLIESRNEEVLKQVS